MACELLTQNAGHHKGKRGNSFIFVGPKKDHDRLVPSSINNASHVAACDVLGDAERFSKMHQIRQKIMVNSSMSITKIDIEGKTIHAKTTRKHWFIRLRCSSNTSKVSPGQRLTFPRGRICPTKTRKTPISKMRSTNRRGLDTGDMSFPTECKITVLGSNCSSPHYTHSFTRGGV